MLGRAGGDGNWELGCFKLCLGVEEKEQKSEVLWALRGEAEDKEIKG